VVVLVGGFFLWRYLSSYESTDDAQADVHLYPVSARISGYVVRVNVDDNQWVQKGIVLVEIDPKDYEVAVARLAPSHRWPRPVPVGRALRSVASHQL
jgi:membrane fusion protein (multidrug efflux system)